MKKEKESTSEPVEDTSSPKQEKLELSLFCGLNQLIKSEEYF